MALIGLAAGGLLVLILRSLQSVEPVWDPGVALVVIPFSVTFMFLWGMGAFNPAMSEHAHGPEHADEHSTETAIVPAEDPHQHQEAEERPFAILTSQLWLVATLSLVVFMGFYVFATLPTGLLLQTVNEAEASVAAFETNQTFALPLGLGEFEASQLTVFLGFVAFTIVSILVAASLLWVLVNGLHHNVTQVREQEYTNLNEQAAASGNRVSRGLAAVVVRLTRGIGRFFKWLARALRNGIPAFLGQR